MQEVLVIEPGWLTEVAPHFFVATHGGGGGARR